MDLTCYLHPGWAPLIRPANSERAWMDATPQSYAYRCLPLSIANAHGWELLNPAPFEAEWDGGVAKEGLSVMPLPGAMRGLPISHFGSGVLTWHVEALFRTPPGVNLWVSGPPNSPKDGISPLTGVIETDWAPFTFTMNWAMTRPGLRVRFEAGEPIAHFFPIERGSLDKVEPRFEDMQQHPEVLAEYQEWSRSRDDFQRQIVASPPSRPADAWQKHYMRGVRLCPHAAPVAGHQTKVRAKPFSRKS